MDDLRKQLGSILLALGIGASGGAAVDHAVAPAPAPAPVNMVCPKTWKETNGADPKLQPIDVRGNGVSQFVVCERPDGTQITIFANGTYSGTTRDGHTLDNPKAVLDADR